MKGDEAEVYYAERKFFGALSEGQYEPLDQLLSDDFLLIEVSDRGYGIPAPDLERIFEKFYRVPRVQDAGTPGTGLGLALVREIAELHRGSVAVKSEVSQGSTFTLRIPTGAALPARANEG